MTGPAVDPLADYKSGWQQGGDPLADYHPAWRSSVPNIHQQYASGALGRQMADENAADQADASDGGYFGRLATHVLNTAQGIPGMEAVEAGAGALGSRLTSHPISYAQSLNTLRDQTSQISGPVSFAEKMAGGLATMPFLPKNPAMAGALLGGADQALNADADQSLLERGGRTALGAGAGALIGQKLDQAITALKVRGVPTAEANAIARVKARGAQAATNYGTALADGAGKEVTPAVQSMLAAPDIADIVTSLKGTRTFANTSPSDPKFLDAVYKALSDKGKALQKGLATADPANANAARVKIADIESAKQQFLSAMAKPGVKVTPPIMYDVPAGLLHVEPKVVPGREPMTGPLLDGTAGSARGNAAQVSVDASGRAVPVSPRDVQGPAGPAFMLREQAEQVHPGVSIETPAMRVQTAPGSTTQLPPMMPQYPHAVDAFAEATKGINAVKRGAAALNRSGVAMPATSSFGKTNPAAFADWLAKASPDEKQAAIQGILGQLKGADKVKISKVFGIPLVPYASKPMSAAPGLLRMVDPNASQHALLGLLALHSATP